MPAPTMSHLLQHVLSNIPKQVLNLAFQPERHQTTLDARIISEVIEPRVLMDVNLLTGKKTRIELLSDWIVPVSLPEFAITTGAMYDACYFRVPPEFREFRNIATVQGISSDYTYSMPINSGSVGNVNNIGNTVSSLADAAVSSRTEYNFPIMPAATLQQLNMVRVYPNTYSDGLVLDCTLEYDLEFTNANQNVIYHLRYLVLCAVKAWIYNELVIQIDTAEIIGGMAIGAIKDRVVSYENANDEYHDLLMKVRGGSIMDPEMLGLFVSMML